MNLAHIIAKEVYSVLHERDTQPEIIDKLLKPHAKKILAKHDENYMPPEVKEALENNK